MSFSQMTTAAFSSGRKNVEELLATARRFRGRERQQAKAIKAGRALRAQLDFARYLQKRTADPQSYISPSPAKHRRRHRRKRFLLIFYPFRSSRRFLLQSAVLRPPYRTFSDGVNITPRRPHRWLIIRRRDLARSIPNAGLVLLPNASHIFLTDQLEPARDAILAFLERTTVKKHDA